MEMLKKLKVLLKEYDYLTRKFNVDISRRIVEMFQSSI